LTGDMTALTNLGKVRLDEIDPRIHTHVRAFDHAAGRDVWAPLADARCTGRRADIWEIRTVGGGRVTCTADHRVWTERGYVEARHLRPGMRVLRDVDAQPADLLAGVLEQAPGQRPEMSVRSAEEPTEQVLL